MKKVLSVLLSILMIVVSLPFSVQAESVIVPPSSGTLSGGQTYTYDGATGTLTICGDGAIANYTISGSNVSPFKDCTITNIVIEDGITNISDNLFYNAKNIRSVFVPSSVVSITPYAFRGAGMGGTGFDVDNENKKFSSVAGSLYSDNGTCLVRFVDTGVDEFVVPADVNCIKKWAFLSDVTLSKLAVGGTELVMEEYAIDKAKIDHIELKEGLKSIGSNIKVDNLKDTQIYVPSTVDTIGIMTFLQAPSVKAIIVSPENKSFYSIDGVVVDSTGTLAVYPGGKQDERYITPPQVNSVGVKAFCDNNYLVELIIANGVTKLERFAISYLYQVEKIVVVNQDCTISTDNWLDNVYTDYVLHARDGSAIQSWAEKYGASFQQFDGCIDHIPGEIVVIEEPECELIGSGEYYCLVCDEFINAVNIPANGHSFTEYVSNHDATCTEDGTEKATCDNCTKTNTRVEVDSALGHSFTKYVSDDNATCSSNCTETSVCDRCEATDTRDIEGSALPHTYDSGVITKSATCTMAGVKTYTCSVCDATKKVATPKLAHTYKTYTTRATTSKNGSVVTKCTVCGTVKSKSTIYYPKKMTLSTTSYTYNGKVKKPSVKVVGSNGKTISSSNYTVTYASGRKNVGKYKVTVRFKGNYSGTKTLYFTIKPKATSISSISARSKGFYVKWYRRSTQTTGYQVQYSTSGKFTGPKTVTISKYSTISKTVSKLKAKKRYYVRVRTYKTVNGTRYYSSWSKYKTVTTKS
ncbi:MAG: leucine-rich repeat protein [Eubacterium sp.]